MSKFKIATVLGARPQFIKAAVVSKAFGLFPAIEEVIIHTGQHYDDNMSEIFFRELSIPEPAYNLNIGSGLHGRQTGRMLIAIEEVLIKESPDWVLIYGDTNSTLAGALAAAKLRIPAAHVEAGLRSFDRHMPEEINRVVADHTANVLFVPTAGAFDNLLREGLPDHSLHLVGDVMYDAALLYGSVAEKQSRVLERLRLANAGYVLATVHRAENTDDRNCLHIILAALGEIARDLPVVLPLHPRTRCALTDQEHIRLASNGIRVIDPVGYLDMIMLEKHARLIATDSGGVQKEAYFHRVPCVTYRDATEWTELVEMGWNRLAPPRDIDTVVKGLRDGLESPRSTGSSPFGDGHAADHIAGILAGARSASSSAVRAPVAV
jgi:UDP-GlcNAc3NAcA epimerase